MKLKYTFAAAALMICLCIQPILLLTGCSGTQKADITPLLGTWQKAEGDMQTTFTLNSDCTYTQRSETTGEFSIAVDDSGTFAYDGKTLTFTSDDFGTEFSYEVSFSGDIMYWDSGEKVLEYKRNRTAGNA